MEREKSTEHIAKIMESLDGIRQASPRTFLFTRIQQQIQQRKENNSGIGLIVTWISRPAVAVTLIAVVLLLNLSLIFWQQGKDGKSYNEQAVNEARDEFSLASAPIYEFENQEP